LVVSLFLATLGRRRQGKGYKMAGHGEDQGGYAQRPRVPLADIPIGRLYSVLSVLSSNSGTLYDRTVLAEKSRVSVGAIGKILSALSGAELIEGNFDADEKGVRRKFFGITHKGEEFYVDLALLDVYLKST